MNIEIYCKHLLLLLRHNGISCILSFYTARCYQILIPVFDSTILIEHIHCLEGIFRILFHLYLDGYKFHSGFMKWYRKTWKSFLINPIFAFEHVIMSSLVAQTVKNLPAIWETQVWSVGWEDALEKGMATHSSVLAWRIPWTEEPGRPQSMGSQRVAHDWAANTLTLMSS